MTKTDKMYKKSQIVTEIVLSDKKVIKVTLVAPKINQLKQSSISKFRESLPRSQDLFSLF